MSCYCYLCNVLFCATFLKMLWIKTFTYKLNLPFTFYELVSV
uniref:Uncharacterized protein n=1 Tax=Anguilla anguilla TaxID=7936 RepID=A0A0E9RM45_ANGAN